MPKNKVFVGLDPSMHTGIVILDDSGKVLNATEYVLKTKSNSTTAEILDYGRHIVDAVDKAYGSSAVVAIEGFAYAATGSSVSSQYGIGYAIRFALIDKGLPYLEPTPSELKKFTTGKGNCKKEVMIKEVFKKWGYEHESNNVIDAYALARFAMAWEEA